MFKALDSIPPPSPKRIAIRVSKEAEGKIFKSHPWLYANSVRYLNPPGRPGDLAVIFDSQRKFLAIGLYDPQSPFIVRILQHKSPLPINKGFFLERLQTALKIREPLLPKTTGFRWVHGENDGFPGLVIDKYHRNLVMKLYTVAWIPHLKELLLAVLEIGSFDSILLRLGRGIQKHQDDLYHLKDGQFLWGSMDSPTFLFRENELWFEANPILGHKTGFYFDQRENREQVETFAEGKKILNLFSYSGGFSLYAARGGSHHVISVDSSAPALSTANRNFARNIHIPNIQKCNHATMTADAFLVLEQFSTQHQQFDMIIIDPPSFAKNKNQSGRAISAYQKLTSMALKILVPGGILVQASCSTQVSANTFFEAIHQAARDVGRPLTELARTNHPLDHPIRFKEGSYLKCIFGRC